MAAVAKRRGWPILKFSSRGPVGLRRQVRTLAGLGSIVPVGAGAVAMGVLTGSRRRGANFFTSIFSQTVLATTGVRLNVVGKENLTAQRPAVFIYNHRNQVDPVIAGALVNDNWVAVAKKELQKNPIMALLGKALDGVFIDRDDSASALETMRTVEERARNGLSIVMAPEGTRLDTTGVGPFKKGPFRLAMAAGIQLNHVPYRGNSQALTDGLGGVVELLVVNSDVVLPHVASGALKPLAVMAPQRLAAWPEVPTMAELKLPQAQYYSNFGVFAPANLPPAVAQPLQAALARAVASVEFKDLLAKSYLQPGTAAGADPARLADEIGDVLFVCVNLARHAQVDVSQALRHANAKFERRFRRMESLAAQDGTRLAALGLDAQDAYWARAKAEER